MLLREVKEYLESCGKEIVDTDTNLTFKDAVYNCDEEVISSLCKIHQYNYVRRLKRIIVYKGKKCLPNNPTDWKYYNHYDMHTKYGGKFNINMLKPNTIFCGEVNLSHRRIKYLPDNIVFDTLYLTNTNLKELPKGLIVNRWLDIRYCNKLRIPKDALINGRLEQNNHSNLTTSINTKNTDF